MNLKFVSIAFGLVIFLSAQAQTKLEKVWESFTELEVPESVIYDSENNCLYVSCIKGNPSEMDGDGYIAKLSMDGKILKKRWLSDIDAPKGMGIFEGKLYVTNISEIVEIDIVKTEVINRFKVEGAKFLNDIDVDKKGNVYVSDMMTSKIHILKNGEVSEWLSGDSVEKPNGLYVHDKDLLIGLRDKVVSVRTGKEEVSDFITKTGGIDGLEMVKEDLFIISDWSGNIHLISANGVEKILDTTTKNENAADIEFVPETMMLYVPTFFANKVTAYKLEL